LAFVSYKYNIKQVENTVQWFYYSKRKNKILAQKQ
jgi:hypothetical protein